MELAPPNATCGCSDRAGCESRRARQSGQVGGRSAEVGKDSIRTIGFAATALRYGAANSDAKQPCERNGRLLSAPETLPPQAPAHHRHADIRHPLARAGYTRRCEQSGARGTRTGRRPPARHHHHMRIRARPVPAGRELATRRNESRMRDVGHRPAGPDVRSRLAQAHRGRWPRRASAAYRSRMWRRLAPKSARPTREAERTNNRQ